MAAIIQNNNLISKIINKYFKENPDFRVQIFNTLGFLGFVLGIVFGVFSLFVNPAIPNVATNFSASVVAAVVIWRANRTGKFKLYFLITVIVVFLVIFPILFFVGGGYTSGMPSFFVFAVVFTVIMLEGRRRTVFTVLEIVIYFGCFLTAYFFPETVVHFPAEADMAKDIIVGSLAVAVVLAVAIYQHIIVYDRKQKELEKANEQLEGLNRMKTEFLEDMSHEMQNPLTTIIRGIEFADSRIDKPDGAAAAHNALKLAEDEALRLGRMVSSMVNLAAISGSAESREKINFSETLKNCAEMFRLQLDNKDNTLDVDIAPGLPDVYGIADRLKQVPINLLSNAAKHTRNGKVTLKASLENDFITVRISDTGEGIPAELIRRIFERGVSGSADSPGFGLSICQTIMEAHGGEINIESEPCKGTTVTFTIPAYGGQSEVRKFE